ncbi:MAG TPA: ABC transporter substrate-binding protein [Burkholderiales bacterium]|nr:ABC transporter substrate-binding protein [Burkholderiales bacterium]
MKITLIENFRAVFYAPFYAAVALGAYEQEGLQLELKTSSDAASRERFVLTAEGEVSWGGPLRLMHTLEQDPAAGVVAFCEVVMRDPFLLVGRVPNPAFRLHDLAGKRLATVSEVPTPWICLRHDLRLAGIAEAGVARIADGTMGDNARALREGRVDVIQVFEPFAAALEAEGAGHVWYAASARGPTSYTTFNTTRAFLDREPQTALRMCRAMYRTQKWIAAHDARELAETIGPYFPELATRVLASSLEGYRSRETWNATPLPGRAGFEWLRDAAIASGLLKSRFRYEDCVDVRFARQAMREDPPSV